MNLGKPQPKLGSVLFKTYNRPITAEDTGAKFFKGLFIALAISSVFWGLLFYGIYEAIK